MTIYTYIFQWVFCRRVEKIADGEALLIGLTIAIAALPAILYFIWAEKIVDYCGHSNILIYCFVNYIIHHLGKFTKLVKVW